MKFKKDNFWIQVYYNYYNYKYPNTLCGFFWKIVFALFMIITSPLQLIALVINKFSKVHNKFTGISSGICIFDKILQFIIIPVSLLISIDPIKNEINLLSVIYSYIILFMVVAIIIRIFVFIYNLENIYNKHKSLKKISKSEKQPSIIWESIKTLKNKVCPIIELED